MKVWFRCFFLSKWVIFRFHVSFLGCMSIWALPSLRLCFLLKIPSCHVRAVSFREGKKKNSQALMTNANLHVNVELVGESPHREKKVDFFKLNGATTGLMDETLAYMENITIFQKGFMCNSGGFWHQHF